MKYLETLWVNGKILMIFSTKSLIYTGIGAVIGFVFMGIFNILDLKIVGIIMIALLALIGYAIGTFKVPDNDKMAISQKVRRNCNR